jgi:hypothetical protein
MKSQWPPPLPFIAENEMKRKPLIPDPPFPAAKQNTPFFF